MIERRMKIGWLLFMLLMLAGCQTDTADDELSGRVTLWHSWSESEATVLDEALAEFQELHPQARVIPVALPEDHILEEFITAGNDGLGPDILIGTSSWIGELVNTGLIRPLNPGRDRGGLFDSRNRALTQYEDQI